VKSFIDEIDSILAILDREEMHLSGEQAILIKEREQARKNKDFRKSDEIREVFKSQGIILEDTPYGTRWKTVKK